MTQGVLGHKVAAPDDYAPELLFAVPRALGRASLGLAAPQGQVVALPFFGVDAWTAYELAWRNLRGVPQIAVLQLFVPIESANLVESKSLKLYLGSLHRRRFAKPSQVLAVIEQDVGGCVGAPVQLKLQLPQDFVGSFNDLPGTCVDEAPLDLTQPDTAPDAQLLLPAPPAGLAPQQLFSRLLRSLCPVTGQPDWADLQICMEGAAVQPASLLRYVVAFAGHTGFHEQCVERIYCDLQARLRPSALSVYARYTRRGGIDINPFRSSRAADFPQQLRTFRQ